MRCDRCQKDAESGRRFCFYCGYPLAEPPAPPPPARTARAPQGAGSSCAVLTAMGVALGFMGLLAVGLVLLVTLRSPWPGRKPALPPPVEPTVAAEPEAPWLDQEPASPEAPAPSPEPAQPAGPNPEADLAEYYRLLSEDRFPEAFALRSRRSRAKTPLSELERAWSNNRSVRMDRFSVAARKPGRVQVEIRLHADDVDPATGKAAVTAYLGKVSLVLEEDRWRYDGGDFTPVLGARATVDAFYRWYLARQERPSYRERMAEVRHLFHPVLYGHLVEAFRKAPGDGAWLDVDPFADSQMGADGFTARERSVNGDRAIVDVAVTNRRGGRTKVAVHLEKEGDLWRMADLEYSDAPTRLLPWLREINGHD